ncbi:hypothetical protein ACWGH3_31030 [Streptomyces sp. NPDC054884]
MNRSGIGGGFGISLGLVGTATLLLRGYSSALTTTQPLAAAAA